MLESISDKEQLNKSVETNSNTTPKDSFDKPVWLILRVMIIVGVLLIIFFGMGTTGKFAKFLSAASTGLLIAGAFFAAGGFGGFLFGIPKLIQNTSDTTGLTPNKFLILHNDNLVQISDWLTKIIVGVGLTQLYNIPGYLVRIGEKFKHNFGDNLSGRNVVIALVLYFVVIGFMFVYIWTRFYFVRMLKDLGDELGALQMLNNKVEHNTKKIELNRIQAKIDEFEKVKNNVTNAETNFEGVKELFAVYKPAPITILEDAQKGRWGGASEVNGIKIEASFEPSLYKTVEGERTIYTVTLTVSGSEQNPLTGKVYYFLHESFIPNHIMVHEAINNVSSIQIESYEASTVGVLCQGGSTVLELDLNQYPGSPADYRYKETLESVTELNTQKDLLSN